MALFALVVNLATIWRYLHWFKTWSFGCAICIDSKGGHQVVSLASLALSQCLGLPYWHYQFVLSWYLHQLESHQLSFKKLAYLVRDNRTHRSDPNDTWVK